MRKHDIACDCVLCADAYVAGKKRLSESSASPACSMRAEVRNERSPGTDEYDSYLVLVVDGKSYPYIHIPESMPDEILRQAIEKLSA